MRTPNTAAGRNCRIWKAPMSQKNLEITPSTKVAELLAAYPELEAVLIGMAPPFKKLKNPVLRRSVAT